MNTARTIAVKMLKEMNVDAYIAFILAFVSLSSSYYAFQDFEIELLLSMLKEVEDMRVKRASERAKIFSFARDEEIEIMT